MIWAPHIRVDGNTTTDDQGNTEQYDAWNRLVTVKSGTLTLMTYTYDGTGRRITEQSGSAVYPTNIYYSSGWQDIMETIGAAGVTSQAQYIWSPVYTNALILRDYDFTADGTFTLSERGYALQDANYNVTAVVSQHTINGDYDEDGDVDIGDLNQITAHWQAHLSGGDAVGDFDHDGQITIQDLNSVTSHSGSTGNAATWVIGLRMVYDPYGNFTTYNGGYTVNPNYLAWNITFQGGREDLDRKTIDNRGRVYDVTMARTFQEDPMGYVDGLNFHVWELDNPVNCTDPSGLKVDWSKWNYKTAHFDPHGTFWVDLTGAKGEGWKSTIRIGYLPDKYATGGLTKDCGADEIRFVQLRMDASFNYIKPTYNSGVFVDEPGHFYQGKYPFYELQDPWIWSNTVVGTADMTDTPHLGWDVGIYAFTQRFLTMAVVYSGKDEGTIYGAVAWQHSFWGPTKRATRSIDGLGIPPKVTVVGAQADLHERGISSVSKAYIDTWPTYGQ